MAARRAHNPKVTGSSPVPATNFGGVAQLARAFGSYPKGHRFDSCRRYHYHLTGPLGQAVKTPPFHGGNRGSIPLGVTKFGRIAQLGEHLPYKQGVTGSIPVAPTIL